MVGLPDGEKNFEDVYNRFDPIRRVTDRQTDKQTSCQAIVCAMHTRRAVKIAHWSNGYVSPGCYSNLRACVSAGIAQLRSA